MVSAACWPGVIRIVPEGLFRSSVSAASSASTSANLGPSTRTAFAGFGRVRALDATVETLRRDATTRSIPIAAARDGRLGGHVRQRARRRRQQGLRRRGARADLGPEVVRHIMRHTCATWMMLLRLRSPRGRQLPRHDGGDAGEPLRPLPPELPGRDAAPDRQAGERRGALGRERVRGRRPQAQGGVTSGSVLPHRVGTGMNADQRERTWKIAPRPAMWERAFPL